MVGISYYTDVEKAKKERVLFIVGIVSTVA